jgi:hypothetical protein
MKAASSTSWVRPLCLATLMATTAVPASAAGGLIGMVMDYFRAKRQASEARGEEAARIMGALVKGKAIIFFPVDSSVATIWKDDLGDDSFTVGSVAAGLDGPKLSSVTRHNFIVVEPGTYFLSAQLGEKFEKTRHVQYANRASVAPGLGVVKLTNTQFPEYYTVQEWQSARWDWQNVTIGQRCSAMHPNGQCVGYWEPITQHQQVLTRQAGYYDVQKKRMTDGIGVEASFSEAQSPAKITVGIGEVVVTDGLRFEAGKGFGWDENQCLQADASTWLCSMTNFSVRRVVPSDAQGKGQTSAAVKPLLSAGMPPEMVARIQYRPLTMTSRPVNTSGATETYGPR